MEKNRKLQTFSGKKDFDLLKREAFVFSRHWLRVFFLPQADGLKAAWSLSKKNVPFSVVRNRLKRWGRENLKKSSVKGMFLFVFLRRNKGFYKKLKRRDFDEVFSRLLERIQKRN